MILRTSPLTTSERFATFPNRKYRVAGKLYPYILGWFGLIFVFCFPEATNIEKTP